VFLWGTHGTFTLPRCRWSARLRRVPLLVAFILSGYLPLEAFDGDAQDGLNEAVLGTPASRGHGAPRPTGAADPPPQGDLPSVRPRLWRAAQADALPDMPDKAQGQARRLRASAPARASPTRRPLHHSPFTIRHWTHADALPATSSVAARAFGFVAQEMGV